MVTEIRTLRVSAEIDASKYTAAAETKQTADRKMAQSGREAAAAIGETARAATESTTKISQAGDVLGRLSRQYVDGYASSQRMTQAINQLSRGVELGKIQMSEASVILDGIYRKYQMMGDATRVAERGQIELARAIEQANAKLTAQRNIAPANMNVSRGGGGVASGYTSNIAAQFQDIGVTAAMGMSPIQVALQQGTQLSAVFNDIQRSGQGLGASLAAAFTSIISPMSLVTLGLVAGSVALIQYFSSGDSEGEKLSKRLEDQNNQLREAVRSWGDATPALKAYVDQLDRADKITQGRQAGDILAGRELEGLSENLDSIKQQGIEAFRALRGDENNAEVVRDLRTAWSDLRERLNDGSASMADLNSVQRELTRALATNGVPEVQKFKDAFDDVTEAIYRGVQAAQQARTAYIAAIAGGTNVQDIVAGSTFTEGGRTYRQSDFMPANPAVPSGRPLVELEGLPGAGSGGAPTILNSDGRLVNVPIPGQRPNYFEREEDMPEFGSFRANRNTYWSRDVLNEEKRRQEFGDVFKGFFTDFGSALRENSGDLGKALLSGLTSSVENAAAQAFERFANLASTMIVNALLGQPSAGLMNKSIGFTGANTTLGQILGAGGGISAANNNVAGGFSGLAGASSVPNTEIAAYISQAAIKRGIDPATALAVAKSEGGLNSWNLQSQYVKNGVQEPSFGPFQLYKGGGLGNAFMAKTGMDPALASSGPAGVDFALDHASKNGWGAWYGAAKAGIGDWQGIGTGGGASEALNQLATASSEATTNLGGFGKGIGQLGQSLSGAFPAAPSSPGGGGGLFGWFGNLFTPNFSKIGGQAALAASGSITGLFADGTEFSPGGVAMVGERGRELVRLPRGSQVVPNHRTESMLAANANQAGGARGGSVPLNINIMGANGDEHVRKLVEQGVSQALAVQNEEMTRSGFGEIQRRYSWQKA